MRSPSALTGRTTERVTQVASATAASSATSAMMMINRVPELAVASASCTAWEASLSDASISLSPACPKATSALSTSSV
jgi:hypothetical protein